MKRLDSSRKTGQLRISDIFRVMYKYGTLS